MGDKITPASMNKGPPSCPYCKNQAVLCSSAEVYNGVSRGLIWICRPCQAWVGVHKNSKQYAPLGRLANAELRQWKIKAHKAFDPLWQAKIRREGCTKHEARNAAYKWLSTQLGISKNECHIGMFDVELCKTVHGLCMSLRKSNQPETKS